MRKYMLLVVALIALAALVGPVAQAAAPNTACGFVYTNDDNFNGVNTVTTFKCDSVTGLTNMGQTPTGGNGQGGGFFGADRIKVLAKNNYLYANDAGTGDIAIFSGANTGALTHLANFNTGMGGDVSLVAGGPCVIAGFANFGVLNSYKASNTTPYLTLVSSVSAGTIDGIAAAKSGSKYYVAWGTLSGVSYTTVDGTCTLGSAPGSIFGVGGEAGVNFSADGTKIYAGIANGGSTTIEEGPFPAGPLTAFTYGSGGSNSNTVVVNKTGTCAYAGDSFSPGVTAIDMVGGIPGSTSTFVSDGSGNFYSGQIILHKSEKAVFIMSTSGSNQVDTFLTGTGCSKTLSFKNGVNTNVSGPFSMSLTAAPQNGF